MPVRVPSAVRKAFLSPDSFTLEVRSASLEQLAVALESFRHSIFDIGTAGVDAEWPGPAWVSEVIQTPSSCLLFLDLGEPPEAVAEEILAALPRLLDGYQVPKPSVALAKSEGPFTPVYQLPNGVVLRAYPTDPQTQDGWPFDPSWVDEAFDWLQPTGPVPCDIVSVQFTLEPAAARSFVNQQLIKAGTNQFQMLTGDTSDRIRVSGFLTISVRKPPSRPAKRWANLLLAAGGPNCGPHDLVAEFEALTVIGRRLASHAEYILIDFVDTLMNTAFSDHRILRGREGGAAPGTVDLVRDVLALDGFPWQMLGPGHVERLGAPPKGSIALGEGRVELGIGDPREWLAETTKDHARRRARELLAPCLLSDDEAAELSVRLGRWSTG